MFVQVSVVYSVYIPRRDECTQLSYKMYSCLACDPNERYQRLRKFVSNEHNKKILDECAGPKKAPENRENAWINS